MRTVALGAGADLDGFRRAARALVAQGVAPEGVLFTEGVGLFADEPLPDAPAFALPKSVPPIVADVVRHSDPERYGLLYRLIWRVVHGERALPEVVSDPLIHRLHLMRKSLARDIHKMHAFVRFRQVETPEGERYVAWFEPEHHILESVGPFFRDRFGSLHWSILTPRGTIHWDRERLAYGPPATRADAPDGDAFEAGWRAYYESIFNPARANPGAMRAEMPKKYWKNLPETQSIPAMLQGASARVERMVEQAATVSAKREPTAALAAMHRREPPASLEALNRAIAAYVPPVAFAPRAVLGEGPVGAGIAFVGEQPGDQEEIQGRPFVGPAGQLLMRALNEAGIVREEAYLTNAVKHFKFEARGKRRIHVTPSAGEVRHYRWWLMDELDLVAPRLVVALGATAALALTGRPVAITRSRGPLMLDRGPGFVTVHPSYLLRLPDEAARERAYAAFVGDLKAAQALAAGEAPAAGA
ncbi:UdgX family uracil-DNA binding protein [Salinarimonas soli]|uniref:Type-4 uracil-DNA glycosylase n=1 Tax=Salinarimonas soli TaxID=1638099 RepID=A0A5B2VBG6_9HYPH|nr:UdgX family uracil-DNA binding protein [Salinarimonas soli]KAA2235762.1 UdgX family uracil-DNA binding protein [Salinarimonas soli]